VRRTDKELASQPIGLCLDLRPGSAAAVKVHQDLGELVLPQELGNLVCDARAALRLGVRLVLDDGHAAAERDQRAEKTP
jgi:hypothetical protein